MPSRRATRPRRAQRAGTRPRLALFSSVVWRGLALGAALAVPAAVPSVTRARADFPPEPAPPLGAISVVGEADLDEVALDTRCRTARHRARCVVTLTFVVRSNDGAGLTFPPIHGARLDVDGHAFGDEGGGALDLAPGEARRVRLRVRRTVWEDRSEGLYLVAEAAFARHAALGEFQHIRRSDGSIRVPLFEGPGLHLRGSVRVASRVGRRVTVETDAGVMPELVAAQLSALPRHLDVTLEGPRETPRWLRRGGPVFMLGSTVGDQQRLVGRAGYEAGFGRHGFVQALVESDLQRSLALALVLEGALPAPLFLIPSLSAGAGLVVETRADPRVALRFSLGAMLGAGLGAQATLDWDPRGRRTTLALVGRLSF